MCKRDPKLVLSTTPSLGYHGLTINVGNDKNKPLGKDPQGAAGARSVDRPRGHQPGRVQRRVRPGNQWVSPEHPYYQQAFPIPKRDVAKAKALLKEAGVTPPLSIDFMVPKGAEYDAVAEVVQSMAAEAGFDLKIRRRRIRDLVQAGRGRQVPALPDRLERPHRSRRQLLRFHA